jgi:hypothetical protein
LEAGYQRFASGFEGVPFETMTGNSEVVPGLSGNRVRREKVMEVSKQAVT